MLKKAISALLLGVVIGFVSVKAMASEDKPTLGEAIAVLDGQLAKLGRQKAANCPQDYAKIYSEKDLRISMFYGYENFDNITVDFNDSRAMAHVLQRPCKNGLEVCGFHRIKSGKNMIRLQRAIEGKDVTISIISSSLTDDNYLNMDANGLYFDQKARSREVREQFYKSLRTEDIVIYSGHSRLGGGPGFEAVTELEIGIGSLFRWQLKPVLKVLSERPTRLKVLGMMSCDSNKYYREGFEKANPRLSLILSHDEIETGEGEQITVGILNSILAKKCAKDVAASMVSVEVPAHKVMEFKNKK